MKKTRTTILNYLIFSVLFASAALLTGKAAIETDFGANDSAAPTIAESPVIQLGIDPGHGGVESGANVGDVIEKDLNLSVSECHADI